MEGGIGAAAGDGDRLMGGGAPVFGVGVPVDSDFDIASYEDVNVAIVANLHTANQNGTGPLIDTYAGMDGLVGTRLNDSLTGAGIDTISTNGFNNVLIGGAGDDVLTGLSGDDIIIGDSAYVRNDLSVVYDPAATGYTLMANWKATGEDRPDFGVNGGLGHILGDNGAASANDRAVFSGRRSDYTVTGLTALAAATYLVVDNRGIDSTAAGDIVKDVEFFQFSDRTVTAANLINQAPAGAVTISGWASAGQPAASPYILTADASAVQDPNGIEPASRTFQWQTSADGGATWTNAAGATAATFAPTAATQAVGIYLSGTNGANTLNGTANQDVLLGNGGNDVLRGFGGDDLVDGGVGNDTIWATIGDGNDTYTGGAGIDTLNLSATTADANVNLGASAVTINGVTIAGLTAASAQTGTDTLSGIESVVGSSGANILDGGDGADILSGGAGADRFLGGAGNDTLTGGTGNDTFVFYVSFGDDTVTDFHHNAGGVYSNSTHDTLEFHGFTALGITTFNELLSHTTVTFDGNGVATSTVAVGTDHLVLEGVNLQLLSAHAGDFQFLA